MPRALIVTSMAVPYLAADAHRARVLAGALPNHGWEVELLVPDDRLQRPEHREPRPELFRFTATVHRAPARWHSLFRLMNSRTLGWTAFPALLHTGDQLLSGKRFDLVYFSSAQHPFSYLGARWWRKFGVPFVVDWHDPWFMPDLGDARHLPKLKARVSNRIAQAMERATMSAASGLVSVSAGYFDILNRRYHGRTWAALRAERQLVLPFGVDAADLEAARTLANGGSQPSTSTRTIVYTGAGSTIMEKAFRELCQQLAAIRRLNPEILSNISIRLYGTEPLAQGRAVLGGIAEELGLSDLIAEQPQRIGYLEALSKAANADGLLVLGVDDPAYMPSKLFLYAMTGKPMLACMHKRTVAADYFRRASELGYLIHFNGIERSETQTHMVRSFLNDVLARLTIDRTKMLAEWQPSAVAQRHAALFDRIIADERLRR